MEAFKTFTSEFYMAHLGEYRDINWEFINLIQDKILESSVVLG